VWVSSPNLFLFLFICFFSPFYHIVFVKQPYFRELICPSSADNVSLQLEE
jgi:hypothetical protein